MTANDRREHNVATIQAIYAAFGRGDVPAILEQLHDDVDWGFATTAKGIPWLGRFRGKAEVPRFFQALVQDLDTTKFMPRDFAASDDHVAVLIEYAEKVKKTGAVVEGVDAHHWTFSDDGRIAAFRAYTDTAAYVAAYQGR